MRFTFDTRDISMSDIVMFLVILIGVCVVMWILVAILRNRQNASNNAQPVRRAWARVVDKPQLAPGSITLGDTWVTFELKNGERLQLTTRVQNSPLIGDEGMLTWQGKAVRSFERGAQ